jgi:uncharacterized protein YbjT (DUF2867 family)
VLGVQWRVCDLLRPETLPGALAGVRVAYYLVHSMGGGHADFCELERRSPWPAIELRASMVIGNGSASWQIVRDLAMRLPFMVLPRWLKSRTRPVALDDVIAALAGAAELPLRAKVLVNGTAPALRGGAVVDGAASALRGGAVFDIPGPEILSGREILERIAALDGRHIVALEVPLLTPELSALWLKLVTSADFTLARELVLGLRSDLLPQDDSFWQRIGHDRLVPFDEAARRALAGDAGRAGLRARIARAEEKLVGATTARKRSGGERPGDRSA